MKLIWIVAIIAGIAVFFCSGLYLMASIILILLVGAYIVLRLIYNIITGKELLKGIRWRK